MIMLNTKFYRYSFWVLVNAVIITALTGFKPGTNATQLIELQKQKIKISPKEFFIADVVDRRAEKLSIGRLISPTTQAGKALVYYNANFKDGFASIKSYVINGLPVNKNSRPVLVQVKAFKVEENPLGAGKVNGQISLSIAFGLTRDDDFVHLIDYNGSAVYQRKTGTAQDLEPILRSTINNSLIYFNNWINMQADNNINLAKGVKVIFTDYKEKGEGDTIYYNVNRPLKWTDFKDKPQISTKFGAAVFASLGYTEEVKLIKGIVNVKINLKVYVPKSACWVKDGTADDYALNHEQRHFDIVKIIAGRFKQRILTEKLSTYNYDGPINVAYFDALREIDKMQKQYDGETQHSINTYQQQLWNIKIDNELEALGIKPNNI
jgi:hypothetical protein